MPPDSHHSIFSSSSSVVYTWARTKMKDHLSTNTQYILRQWYWQLCMFLTRSYTYILELHSQTCVSNQNVRTYKTWIAFTVQPFGEFDDRNGFNGWAPGEEYFRDVFVACFSTMCTFFTAFFCSIMGRHVSYIPSLPFVQYSHIQVVARTAT